MAISSPCVRNCCLDDEDICLGCGRSVEEIMEWGNADNNERLKILGASKKRMIERDNKYSSSKDISGQNKK